MVHLRDIYQRYIPRLIGSQPPEAAQRASAAAPCMQEKQPCVKSGHAQRAGQSDDYLAAWTMIGGVTSRSPAVVSPVGSGSMPARQSSASAAAWRAAAQRAATAARR